VAAAPLAPSTYTLSGTISEVVLTALVPLGGAVVEEGTSGSRTTTNEQGFYSISGLTLDARTRTVTVSKAGYKSETRDIYTPSAGGPITTLYFNAELVRESDLHTLTGVVVELTSNGPVPVEGASIEELSCTATDMGCAHGVSRTVKTDLNGFYSISGLYPGKHNGVWVTKEGFLDPYPPRPEAPEGGAMIAMDADVRFDVQLLRR
jgi:hypothetical protein